MWSDPSVFRAEVRSGRYRSHTAGQCPGFTQGNLAILPHDYAEEFLNFCRLNPKPCPLIGMTARGSSKVPELGDVDIRYDFPAYSVFRNGELAEEVNDLVEFWHDGLVGFVLGCSYSFEDALLDAGIPLRHIEQGTEVPIYITNVPNTRAGRFGGHRAVSMRPMTTEQAIRAVQVTSRFPNVHGAPVHLGSPEQIGISDLAKPDYGHPVVVKQGEIPVFWACGVTPQRAIHAARPPFAVTHKPNHMLVTDIRNASLAVL